VQSLQVRGFALCMLPAARKASVLFSQQSRLSHVSSGLRCVGIGRHDQPPGLPARRARHLRRFGLDRSYRGSAAARLELVIPTERLERPGAQRCAAGARRRMRAPTRSASVARKAPTSATSRIFNYVGKDVLVKAENGEAKEAIGCGNEGAYVLAGGSRHGERAQRQCRDAGKLPGLRREAGRSL